MNNQKVDKLLQDFLNKQENSFVEDALLVRLVDCAKEYDLDIQVLFDYEEKASIASAMLENVKEGFLDVVGIEDGEPRFRAVPEGLKHVETLLSATPEGKALVDAVREKTQQDDAILAATDISE